MSSNVSNQITLLGTGTSTGVPIPGCSCSTCQSNNPSNKRLRTSAYLKTAKGHFFLIDTGTDLRTQLLNNHIRQVDAVIYTHAHADHVHGIDDIRPLCFIQQKEVPCFGDEKTIDEIEQKFNYIFKKYDKPPLGGGIPQLKLNKVVQGNTKILDENFYIKLLPHGHFETLSFIHEKMAYATDCVDIPGNYLDKLKNTNLDLLLLDCTRYKPHSTHLHFEKSLDYAEYIGAKLTRFIHLSHDFEHEKFCDEIQARTNLDIKPGLDQEVLFYT